jgi:imidazolonepropionase-like amidohydrolase
MHRESIRRAAAAGVKIAMGTDSGVTPHGQNLRELVLMRELGMTPEAVLMAATTVAAELLGLDGELGSLEPGKRADLVMVEGDALVFEGLEDRIVAVFKDGQCAVRHGSLDPGGSSALPSTHR